MNSQILQPRLKVVQLSQKLMTLMPTFGKTKKILLGLSAVSGVATFCYFNNEKNKAYASWTSNYVASSYAKWDENWDHRSPKYIRSRKASLSEKDENVINEENEKYKPKVCRHLILIRHGQYNLEGSTDEERILTKLGRLQAEYTGKRLQELGLPYTEMIKSTMSRAQETGSIMSQFLPELPVKHCDLLREGAPVPPEPPLGNYRPEAQKFYEDGARIEAAFRKYFHRADPKQTQDSYTVIVCHANVIRYIVCSPVPKRLLTSTNWISRNDSSNINAILNPDIHKSPRLKYGEKTRGNVIEKRILSKNNCYCKVKKGPRPTLLKRPNTCVSYEGFHKKYGMENGSNLELRRKSLSGCVCGEKEDDSANPESLKSRLSRLKLAKSVQVGDGLKLSDQREIYEEYRQAEDKACQRSIDDFRKKERYLRYNEEGEEAEQKDREDVATILGTQKYGTTTTMTDLDGFGTEKHGTSTSISNYAGYEDFYTDPSTYNQKSVKDFRKEHYFDTHSLGNLGAVQNDHDCVHQFRLDGRMLPEPLSVDTFGRSRCRICDKPMEGTTVNLSKSYFEGEKLSKPKLSNLSKSYEHGLYPKTINLGRGKSRIEIVLKDSDVARLSSAVDKLKKTEYCNSLALRHQKMRLV